MRAIGQRSLTHQLESSQYSLETMTASSVSKHSANSMLIQLRLTRPTQTAAQLVVPIHKTLGVNEWRWIWGDLESNVASARRRPGNSRLLPFRGK